ncbi:MAG: gamma-glutamyltransferase [Gemmatimonadaceae bacterium]|nr:gamma-glutamyltransferase [Gemmatimonadaceae bacterium]
MNTGRVRALSLLVIGAACSPAGISRTQVADPRAAVMPSRVAATFPDGWRFPAGSAVATVAEHAMVASSSRLASEAGVEILKAGGNAIDAAVAVGFALAVVFPEAGNIGGGGYMVIRMADGRTAAIDYREIAPQASFRDMYLDASGQLTGKGVVGRAASGVPGAVAGMTEALAKFGSMPLALVMAPAIRLATEGFTVDSVLSRSVAGKAALITQFAGAATFLPGAAPIAPGTRLIQPELARTLTLVARDGAPGFYRGPTAKMIQDEMQRDCPAGVAPRNRAASGCGIITTSDLEKYRAEWRTPISTSYRGYTVLSMPPSSSGGITVGQTLNILEGYDRLPAFGTAEYFHLAGSAFQRAFIDRNALLGDPAFVQVPRARLESKDYARTLRLTIPADRATPTSAIATTMREGTETTHYSVVDASGNAVATTTTVNSLYGSGVFITGAGFFMNNEMDDFASQPGLANQFGLVQGESNAIAPGKRMLSAMSPTIVLDPRGELLLVVGGRGGPRIITSTAEVILNVIDHRMNLADAMGAPRIHHQALPDSMRFERGGFDSVTLGKLKSMGYGLSEHSTIGASIVAIKRIPGGYEGMDDPRSNGSAVGY